MEEQRTAFVVFMQDTSTRDLNAQTMEQMFAAEGISIPDEYRDLERAFSEEEANKLPEYSRHDHGINTGESEPGFRPLYNLLVDELGVLQEYIRDNLAKGFIRPSISPVGAPILFVKKKDGTLRLCVDY